MDVTVKPVRVPPEIPNYAEKHGIFDLIQSMVSSLVVDKPDDPISYLIRLLRRGTAEPPKIILLGPPASGKTAIGQKLSAELGSVHVTAHSLLQQDEELSQKALQYTHMQEEIPVDMWMRLIQHRLSMTDCFTQGWLLEGFPQTRLFALELQASGLFPNHTVFLQASEHVLLQRTQGKTVDPVTGDEEVAQRQGLEERCWADLHRYRGEEPGLKKAFSHAHMTFNAELPLHQVYGEVLRYVLTRRDSLAPQTPRILLVGPPGCGRSVVARRLADQYRLVDVDCGQLLKSLAADGSNLGQLIKPYTETGQQVPNRVVLQAVTQRLGTLDCATRGWVLHGFPRDPEQAEQLQRSAYAPSRVFFLEIAEDVAMKRLTLRAIDPISGERFPAPDRPAPSLEVRSRLQTHPGDTPPRVQEKLRQHAIHAAGLKALYPDAIHVTGGQDPHLVYECVESRMFKRPDTRLNQ